MKITLPIQGYWFTDLNGKTLNLDGERPWPTDTQSVGAQVRDYAGRRRVIRSATRAGTTSFTLFDLTPDQLDQMLAWNGALLLLRTTYWRRWGMFSELSSTPLSPLPDPYRQRYRVQVTWTDSDRDESV